MPQVHRVKKDQLDSALDVLFGRNDQGNPGQPPAVSSFKNLAKQENYDLTRQMVVTKEDQILYSCFFVPNSGGTAFIFTSDPADLNNDDKESAVQAFEQLRQWTIQEHCNLVQLLLEPDDTQRRDICLRCGFRHLTDLIYLYRFADSIPDETIFSPHLSWQQYDPQHHELFKHVISQTYRDSLDCSELENLRDMEETVSAHKSAGQFDPQWWKILLLNDQPVGVLLLSPLPSGDTMELTYMGLIPSARGQGLAKSLITHAISSARLNNIKTVLLAVDIRNHLARKLYDSLGFKEIFQRTVMYYSSRW